MRFPKCMYGMHVCVLGFFIRYLTMRVGIGKAVSGNAGDILKVKYSI